jgi:hypothetical protein
MMLAALVAVIGVKWQDILPGCCEVARAKPFPGSHGMPATMVATHDTEHGDLAAEVPRPRA